ncbi:MAG: HD domain-containing protein [Solirubrobacterales bacterium]
MSTKHDDKVRLGPEFADALTYTYELHARQLRKGTTNPYLGHLLGVAALVIDAGGSEDEVIAALLHDAAEDQGGEERLEKIERRFGPKVASIVRECSDTTSADVKEPWEERRERYAKHVAEEISAEALRVSLADKLYNSTAIVRDHAAEGEGLWTRFSRGKEQQALRYRGLVVAYRAALERLGVTSPLIDEFERKVEELEAIAAVRP